MGEPKKFKKISKIPLFGGVKHENLKWTSNNSYAFASFNLPTQTASTSKMRSTYIHREESCKSCSRTATEDAWS